MITFSDICVCVCFPLYYFPIYYLNNTLSITPSSYMKTFPTATVPLSIGIIEYKLALDLIVHEVHLRAHQEHQRLLINDDADPLVLHDFVEFSDLVLLQVVHHVAVSVATPTTHVYLHPIDIILILL